MKAALNVMAAGMLGVSMVSACARAQTSPTPPVPPTPPTPPAQSVQTKEGMFRLEKGDWVMGKPGGVWLTEVRPGGKMEKGTYLGLATSRVTPVLRSNLKLPVGVGLVVEQVSPDSPAAEAGIRQYDILQKFNDQLLVNAQQLGVLVRLTKPGEEVTLTVLRAGEPVTAKAKLVESDVPVYDESADPFGTGAWTLPRAAVVDAKKNESLRGALDILRQHSSHSAAAAFTYADPEHTLEISRKDGKRRLVAKNKEGKVVYDGPIDTEKQREDLPAGIREKLKIVDERMKATGTTDDGSVRVRMVRPGEAPVADDETKARGEKK